jgi:hypothetical protein
VNLRDILLNAADHVDEVGLYKGDDYWPDAWDCPYVEGDPACTVGHIVIAAGGGEPIEFDSSISDAGRQAVRHLERHLGVKALGPWNDTPERTAAEVSAALRAAAEAVPRGDAA